MEAVVTYITEPTGKNRGLKNLHQSVVHCFNVIVIKGVFEVKTVKKKISSE